MTLKTAVGTTDFADNTDKEGIAVEGGGQRAIEHDEARSRPWHPCQPCQPWDAAHGLQAEGLDHTSPATPWVHCPVVIRLQANGLLHNVLDGFSVQAGNWPAGGWQDEG